MKNNYLKKNIENKIVMIIVALTSIGIAGSYLLANSDISAFLCFLFGFIAIRYVTDSKFAEKLDEYF